MKLSAIIISLFLAVLFSPMLAWAGTDEEMQTLELFYEAKDLVVTATRNPKPLSQVAENITVITADEMEAIGAHTLADILKTIPGVQVDLRGGPGSGANVFIQGSEFRHVLVLIDGVPFNNLSDNFADVGAIPVRHIDRVEIIKGPASSSWGQALGGVINVVTKSPLEEKKPGGTVSASIGERTTGEYHGDASGTLDRLGYYLFAGKLISDGLLPNNAVDENSLYAKLRWDLPEQGNILFTLGYHDGNRGDGESIPFDLSFSDRYRYLISTLSLNYAVTESVNIDMAARTSSKNEKLLAKQLSSGTDLQNVSADELTGGGSAKLTWRQGMQSLTLGCDFDHGDLKQNDNLSMLNGLRRNIDKLGFFASDTLVIKDLSITPGIRYDRTSTNGDFISPSLGVTYILTDHTMLRGYAGKGYSLPALLSDYNNEKVWAFQAGIESTGLRYLWLKSTLFRNYIWNIAARDSATGAVISEDRLIQGVETEIKTIPLYNTSVAVGFVFQDAENRKTDRKVPNIARNTVDVGIHYNDKGSLRGALTGHYILWNSAPNKNGKYSAMIWDLNLAKKIFGGDNTAFELFLTAHNLFNGAQYADETFKNPRRWFEGGIRFKF